MTSLHARSALLAISLAVLSAGLRASAEPTLQPDADATLLSCQDGALQATSSGVLINNAWNRASAGPGVWRQCLQSRQRDGHTEYGWFWQWPTRDGLYAYPELLIGRSPWRGEPSNDGRFPRSIASIGAMRIELDVASRHQGKKNLAVEFWLTDPASRSIKAELMVWSDASPGLEARSEPPSEVVQIEGRRYAVQMHRDWGDASGGSPHKWTFITYRALEKGSQTSYDARRILQHAIDHGWIEARDQVEGVELGNEIVSGSGSTWIRRFTVTIE